ncbi:MAG TPA: hypothetical protein VM939_09110 [Gemmatimonadaceae bacterium]|nr:hypothetical protein [Gemmatimonadaceae bacterium]
MLSISCRDASGPGETTREATILAAASPTSMNAVVGSFIAEPPSVIVQDADGNPVSGIAVVFYVVSGGGSLVGRMATSNASGVAKLGGWMLGPKPGLNVVHASSGSLGYVTFSATTTAGPPALIRTIAGEGQSEEAGQLTRTRPSVRVTDAYANGLAGLTVVFSISSGGGSVIGDSVVTDTAGMATVGGWRLGPERRQVLAATVNGLSPVTFTAVANFSPVFSPCGADNVLPENTTARASLTNESCKTANGTYYERVQITLTVAGAYRFSLGSDDFDTSLELRQNQLIANNDDRRASQNSDIKALLPAGTYTLIVTSKSPGVVGSYSLSYMAVSEGVDGCEEAFIARGVHTVQHTTFSDCEITLVDRADRFYMYLLEGSKVTFVVEDLSYSGHLLTVWNPKGEQVGKSTTTGWVETLVFTATAEGYYAIDISNYGDSGAEYMMSVQ